MSQSCLTLFASLPDELQRLVVAAVKARLVEADRGGYRLLNKTFAELLKDMDWETSENPFIIVKGILTRCTEVVRLSTTRWEKMTTDEYVTIYNKIYTFTIQKGRSQRNQAAIYDQLGKQLQHFVKCLPDWGVRNRLLELATKCFSPVMRYHAKPRNLPTPQEMIFLPLF